MARKKKTFLGMFVSCIACVTMGVALCFTPSVPVVAEGSTVATDALFAPSTNATLNTTLNDATGVKVATGTTLNGVFKETAKIEYTMENYRNVVFGICDTNGEEIVTYAKVFVGAYHTLPYAYYNGTFSMPGITYSTITNTPYTTDTLENAADIKYYGTSYVYPEPAGANSGTGKEGYVQFALEDNIFKITVEGDYYQGGWNEGVEFPVANFALTEADAAKLANGFKIQIRALDSTKVSDVSINAAYAGLSCVVTKINDVAINGTTTQATATESIFYEGAQDNVITLAYGTNLNAFTYKASYAIGSFAVASTASEEITYTEDFSAKPAGEYSITVSKGVFSQNFTVIVKDPLSVATDTLFAPSTNATLNTTLNDATGVKVATGTTLNGVFKDMAKIEYTMDTAAKNAVFGICDLDGNEIITFVKAWRDNWHTIPYAYYNGTFSTPNTINAPNTTTTAFTSYDKVAYGSTTYIFPEPGGGDGEKVGYVNFVLANGVFKISAEGKYCRNYANNDWPVVEMQIANFELTEADATKLVDGFKIQIRELDDTKVSDVTPKNSGLSCVITKINDVAVSGENVAVSSISENISYDDAQDNVITLAYGTDLDSFVYTKQFTIGSFTGSENEEFTYGEDFDEKVEGEYEITVEKYEISQNYKVVVVSPLNQFTFEMGYGAYIRGGTVNGGYGLRFYSQMTKADYEALQAFVGDGNYYQNITFGMIILPYDYIEKNGALTVSQLFGNSAIYDWAVNGEYIGTKTRVINLTTNAMHSEGDTYAFYGAIVDIKEYNLKREFVGTGYIAYTLKDGTVGYQLFDYNDNNIENNTRSIYEVAQNAISSGQTGDAVTWLTDNVLNGVDYTIEYYTVDGDVTTKQATTTLYGLVGSETVLPAKAFEGYTFDSTYEGSVLKAILEQGVETVLKVYFVKQGV